LAIKLVSHFSQGRLLQFWVEFENQVCPVSFPSHDEREVNRVDFSKRGGKFENVGLFFPKIAADVGYLLLSFI
jgi:hypothetical protein